MIYYHRYPGDYLIGASGLSMIEDGAYTRLVDVYYGKEEPIEHARRYDVGRATKPAEKKAVDDVLARFFYRDGAFWRHERVDEEIAKAKPRIDAARANGKKGGRPRSKNPPANPPGNPPGFQQESHRGTQTQPGGETSHTSYVNNSVGNSSTSAQTEERTDAEARDSVLLARSLKRMGMLDAGVERAEILAMVRAGVTPERACLTAADMALRDAGLRNDPDVHPDLRDMFASGATPEQMCVTPDQFKTLRRCIPTLQYLAGTIAGRARDAAQRQQAQSAVKPASTAFKDQHYGTASLDDLDPEYRAAAERHLPG